ncbi:response regulator transcription factor [Flammeovirga yaeyamensis]|uniref:Response regulator transcription factor n=1 Tax=Flammeovirga yaeyamensis TaxID=367791 RepID=A0AAX1N1B3_9BACT|nr:MULTISPECIES: response regulator transcription factor [Flammeovirga]ANQ47455.1 response regulator transcription factor [Flammeovirga sp. MY04]MBB3698490.1 DNA-binding response OmpR family regulator [Flammeovirga yaeyamensis]NMF34161.1 response regulator transcription factor [Flammeovirga yaeyamensis]QWG01146.1 response regulator transcription factor [Flammeovirga yaeyamensis]
MKLLLIEDNPHLTEDILKGLSDQAMTVETVGLVADAKDKISVYEYDIIVVDLGLPDGNGLEIVKYIKEINPNTGVLIVTARNSIDDKVTGLDLGADDYITKPFHMAELIARVRSLFRRKKLKGSTVLEHGVIKIDITSSTVKINDLVLELTKKEYDLLLYFFYNKNKMLTKESIAEHLWGDHIDQADNFDFIYTHIKNLRKKLQKEGAGEYIKSVYGMGYKFVEA